MLYFIIHTQIIACKKDTVITKTCGCALTNCYAGQECIGGTKCEYPGNKITEYVYESLFYNLKNFY